MIKHLMAMRRRTPRGRRTTAGGASIAVLLAVAASAVPSSCSAFATNGGRGGWGPARALAQEERHSSTARSVSSSSSEISHDVHSLAPGDGIESHSASHSEGIRPKEDEDDHLKTCDVLSLDSIRSTLIRQEETIIFALIERSQFRRNAVVYEEGGFGDLGTPLGSTAPPDGVEGDRCLSFLEYMLIGTEVLHFGARRYTSPEEHAFYPERLPMGPIKGMATLDFPELLSNVGGADSINFNPILIRKYIDVIVPAVTKPGDDEQHGSTALSDIAALQALSRRVHYGKFVAESKYRADPEEYQRLVDAGDADGVMRLLTNDVVEKQVLRRARLKAATYGREPLLSSLPPLEGHLDRSDQTSVIAAAAASAVVAAIDAMGAEGGGTPHPGKVDPAVVESVYRDIIIPLTKDIEVAYLFRRCGREPPPQYAPDRMSVDVTSL